MNFEREEACGTDSSNVSGTETQRKGEIACVLTLENTQSLLVEEYNERPGVLWYLFVASLQFTPAKNARKK